MSKPDLIIHDEKDNVGVVVIETTKKGQDCNAWIMENDKTINVPSNNDCLLYTSPSPRDATLSRMPSSA